MPRGDSRDGQVRIYARIAADAFTYAIAATAVAALVALVLAVATGGGLVRTKNLLFLGGWGLFAFATFRLWPRSPEDVESETARTGDSMPRTHEATRFQRLVTRLPPRRWVRPPRPQRRLSTSGKLLLSGLLVLVLSFLMETVFGVG